jgi:hypothetical protein
LPDAASWPGPDLAGPPSAILDARQRLGLGALLRLGEPMPAEPGPPDDPASARRRNWAAVVPLLAVLVVQAILSFRLIWTCTAFQDEGLYLWAGHLEISHWLHGTPMPPFATYFSGAPVIYPPIGAVADSLGGLAAARGLSLVFMLGASALLWRTTARIFGPRAAFFAAGLFALLGLTLHVGAFATFDALAMLLLAVSVWCAVTASGRDDDATGWVVASAVALALANATAYSSAIFDPVVILLAILAGTSTNPSTGTGTSTSRQATKLAARRGAALFAYVTSLVIVGVTIGGGFYLAGIGQTVVARPYGTDSPATVLETAGRWVAPLAVLAALGAVVSLTRRSSGPRRLIPPLMFGALLLVPAEQARIRTLTSLDKHMDIGAWFAAMAAGYAVDRVIAWLRPRAVRAAAVLACAGLLIFPAQLAVAQAASLSLWPNAADFVAAFAPIAARRGRLLVEDPSVAEYYLPAGRQWWRWSNTRSIVIPSGHHVVAPVGVARAAAFYATYIARGYFSVVALNFEDTGALDRHIAADLAASHSYLAKATIPYGAGDYIVWERTTPSQRATPSQRTTPRPAR